MAGQLQKKEEEIFYQALDKPPEQRAAFLKDACADDKDLHRRVEALLKVSDLKDGFLKSPLVDSQLTLDDRPDLEEPGAIIGRYKLLEKIGEGGMAVVYMAEQQEPIRRKVALKIIKLGMDTKSVIARFEAERQALAIMDHPNIAKVLDAGATETGRPYFVMELVHGISITDFCDRNKLDTRRRLELLVQVCHAVQHAHQKGIIHRDIKPSNVMVTLHEGKPLPIVIDFGIAKATSQRLTEKTLFTRYAQMIGTPEYMSPEQADLGNLDVDTRSDIYSLGVLLYELLTGTTPFSEEELRKAGYLEMQRVIREQEPPKPSTKLSTLGETLTDIAKDHSSTPDLLTKEIRGDLDWIVMKTMEKARDRRYDNASSLAMDVQRHLDDEPILARPPSPTYHLRKFLRRHRTESLAAVAILLLIGTLVIFVSLWSHKRHQLEEAKSSRHRNILDQARQSYARQDLVVALAALKSILTSKHVGPEARVLHDRILSDGQEQLRYYTREIEADPEDAENYLQRARHYYYLEDQRAFLVDMNTYVAIFNPSVGASSHDDWFHHFLVGLWSSTPTNLGPTVNSPYDESVPSISPDGLSLLFVSDRPGGCGAIDLWVTRRATTSDPWNTPVNLGPPVNSPYDDGAASLSADGLSLFFVSERPRGLGSGDIWVSTRRTPDDPWGTPKNLGTPVNNQSHDWGPSISTDGLSLFFDSNRPGGRGRPDIWVTRRTTTNDPWGEPVNLGPNINTSVDDTDVCISADSLSLYIESYRNGGHGRNDLWVTNRATTSDPWGELVNLGPTVNSSASDGAPSVTADGLVLFFSDHPNPRPGGHGSTDIWMMRRSTTSDPWGEPINIGSTVNSSSNDQGPNISSDGSTLYFFSRRSGGYGDFDLWQVSIEPVVDFNRDGNVDSADLCILFDYWGTNESICDIGPTPLGDGIVDIKDMVVFAEYLLGETLPVDLIAHWKLDESEGIYTKDSVGDNDAIVIGSPASLPIGGMVDGALEFNGIIDCLITDSVLNPEDGPFRVFAWIKGGAPGQVVLSQSGGVNWLATDASEGNLMTELAGPGPNSSPLLSQTIVTDGEWHLIGFVWDGSHRTLYVDNVAVAKDTQDGLKGSSMGLYIGTGKTMQPGTYFSGLIDDVRVYSRAVKP